MSSSTARNSDSDSGLAKEGSAKTWRERLHGLLLWTQIEMLLLQRSVNIISTVLSKRFKPIRPTACEHCHNFNHRVSQTRTRLRHREQDGGTVLSTTLQHPDTDRTDLVLRVRHVDQTSVQLTVMLRWLASFLKPFACPYEVRIKSLLVVRSLDAPAIPTEDHRILGQCCENSERMGSRRGFMKTIMGKAKYVTNFGEENIGDPPGKEIMEMTGSSHDLGKEDTTTQTHVGLSIAAYITTSTTCSAATHNRQIQHYRERKVFRTAFQKAGRSHRCQPFEVKTISSLRNAQSSHRMHETSTVQEYQDTLF
ncbi:uncharacterized protein EV420DRAFT_1473419 [Desarmillaria tabescens]|uniref:Uncharacterized protein n=1 Tax=Armillaria tabescens TaxID=1929756 RepID=A0AA39TUA9_ARMTA|nr:uncharacterized protein EV420DRAFT_1473419 [Desarmillaria tabescens]KAK0470367.1 hypothetical protein EV420DRAFT_1473419 [Desarmillaria tabescens]